MAPFNLTSFGLVYVNYCKRRKNNTATMNAEKVKRRAEEISYLLCLVKSCPTVPFLFDCTTKAQSVTMICSQFEGIEIEMYPDEGLLLFDLGLTFLQVLYGKH